jgi:hypothetical protein
VGGCCATHSAAGGGKRRTDMRAVVNGLMWRGAYNLLLLATQYVSCLPGSKYKPPQLSRRLGAHELVETHGRTSGPPTTCLIEARHHRRSRAAMSSMGISSTTRPTRSTSRLRQM